MILYFSNEPEHFSFEFSERNDFKWNGILKMEVYIVSWQNFNIRKGDEIFHESTKMSVHLDEKLATNAAASGAEKKKWNEIYEQILKLKVGDTIRLRKFINEFDAARYKVSVTKSVLNLTSDPILSYRDKGCFLKADFDEESHSNEIEKWVGDKEEEDDEEEDDEEEDDEEDETS